MLIQKDVKPGIKLVEILEGLRALLIQKDVKPGIPICDIPRSLRALLIQKDVKRLFNGFTIEQV